jgi:xylulokinase
MYMPERKDSCILAVDLGTSGPKSALVSKHGQILAHAFSKTDLFLSEGGGACQDPNQWWQAVLKTIEKLLIKHPDSANRLSGICCCAQWSGTVAVDRDGNCLGKAIIWLDSRGSPYIRDITGGILNIRGYSPLKLMRWIRITGGAPSHSGKDSLAHILYIKKNYPEIYARTWKFLEPKDYINFCLTGVCRGSGDSMALHWVTDNRDIGRIRYNEGLIKMCGLDRKKLPDLCQPGEIVGAVRKKLARELGINTDVLVAAGTPDVQAAALSSGAVADFAPHLYIGTSSWLSCHVPFKKTSLSTGIASLPSAVPGRYFVANEQESAGACLCFLKDNLFFPGDAMGMEPAPENFFDLADLPAKQAPPGAGGLLFLPWLYGERTPIDDKWIRGGFINLSLDSSRAHIVRSVLEGVAYNSKWLLGAACLGCIGFEEIEGAADSGGIYTPDPALRDVYDNMFKQFITAYKSTRKICARLNRKDAVEK